MNNIPKITIKYNKFLDPIFKEWILSQERFKGTVVPDYEAVKESVEMYKKEWDKYSEKILRGMCEITGLSFKRNEIDVYVVSVNPRSFSRPIVITSKYTPVNFLNALTHELVHCLYSDNTEELGYKTEYEHENKIVKSHVILHAILKYIYLDVLDMPEQLKANIENCKDSKHGYDIAWDIVERSDYKGLISRLK